MRAIMLTAVVAGFVGLSAGMWLKSTVLATAAPRHEQSTATISPEEIMRNVPTNLPVTSVADYM